MMMKIEIRDIRVVDKRMVGKIESKCFGSIGVKLHRTNDGCASLLCSYVKAPCATE